MAGGSSAQDLRGGRTVCVALGYVWLMSVGQTWRQRGVHCYRLAADLSEADLSAFPQVLAAAGRAVPPIRTCEDLLRHADPPLAVLEAFKEFAKQSMDDPDGPLPRQINRFRV